MTDPRLQAHRARLVRLLHLRALGLDPAIDAYRTNEANTADALEQVTGERLERALGGGDWRGTRTHRIYDDCSPPRAPFFDRQLDNWRASLLRHATLTMGIDIVTVDLRNRDLTRPQIAAAVSLINALPQVARRKVLLLVSAED